MYNIIGVSTKDFAGMNRVGISIIIIFMTKLGKKKKLSLIIAKPKVIVKNLQLFSKDVLR